MAPETVDQSNRSVHYVSFYTPDYDPPALLLSKSLSRLHLPYTILGLPSFPSWRDAVIHKPMFIQHCLETIHADVIVWLDADSIVCRRPVYFERGTFDITARVRTLHNRTPEVLTGVLGISRNARTKRFMTMWVDMMRDVPVSLLRPEQKCFSMMISSTSWLHYRSLRSLYAWPIEHQRHTMPVIYVRRWRDAGYDYAEQVAYKEKKGREDGAWPDIGWSERILRGGSWCPVYVQ